MTQRAFDAIIAAAAKAEGLPVYTFTSSAASPKTCPVPGPRRYSGQPWSDDDLVAQVFDVAGDALDGLPG